MKIGIIGFGNLGRALASGLVKSGVDAGALFVCDNSAAALALAADEYGAFASADINAVISATDVVFLTVKSYVFTEIAARIDQAGLKSKTFVSFMAGMQLEQLRPHIGEAVLVRAMPSLAIAACDGVIGYTKAPAEVSGILNKLGYAFETEPENIEKVMAFSSCGLGFAAYLIDAFAAAGQTMGFTAEESARIASITFKNAVDRGSYRDTVSSVATPGGATEQGVLHMDESDVYGIVSRAVGKAYERMTG